MIPEVGCREGASSGSDPTHRARPRRRRSGRRRRAAPWAGTRRVPRARPGRRRGALLEGLEEPPRERPIDGDVLADLGSTGAGTDAGLIASGRSVELERMLRDRRDDDCPPPWSRPQPCRPGPRCAPSPSDALLGLGVARSPRRPKLLASGIRPLGPTWPSARATSRQISVGSLRSRSITAWVPSSVRRSARRAHSVRRKPLLLESPSVRGLAAASPNFTLMPRTRTASARTACRPRRSPAQRLADLPVRTARSRRRPAGGDRRARRSAPRWTCLRDPARGGLADRARDLRDLVAGHGGPRAAVRSGLRELDAERPAPPRRAPCSCRPRRPHRCRTRWGALEDIEAARSSRITRSRRERASPR